MPTQKIKQKLLKQRVCSVSRSIACVAFLVLAIIGISSLVRAMSLEQIANADGIPTAWSVGSLGNPETITVPITYWDQRQDSCGSVNHQFEWTMCRIYGKKAQQGLVKDRLGADGLPVPAYETVEETRAAGVDPTSEYVLGHDPVSAADNFYQWFHNTSRSQSYSREVTFKRTGNKTYSYGGHNIFPLDNVNYSDEDSATDTGHNFHFTAHLQIPVKIDTSGYERFDFAGDDDVWVFLNGRLVLDIGGVHEKLSGWFSINEDGTLDTYVETAGAKTIDIGLKAGDVVNLDFFYAERSTSESNTQITISGMNWPISADSSLDSEVVGRIADTNNSLVQYIASVRNRNPDDTLNVIRLAAYIKDTAEIVGEDGNSTTTTNDGFLPLTLKTLSVSTNPSDVTSWHPVDIHPPLNSTEGFTLAEPLTLAPSGQAGDTLYFRYFAETAAETGVMNGRVSFYTELDGVAGVAYDNAVLSYEPSELVPQKVSILYQYEDGSEAAEPVEEMLEPGTDFEYVSPEIAGFTPNISVVSGVVQNGDLNYIVIYTPNEDSDSENPGDPETPEQPETPETPDSPDEDKPEVPSHYNLVVHYVFEDGSQAYESYRDTIEVNGMFSVKSPVIDGYRADQEKVTGTDMNSDVELIVRYTKIVEPKPETPPTTPGTPDEPSTPTTPSNPTRPSRPTTTPSESDNSNVDNSSSSSSSSNPNSSSDSSSDSANQVPIISVTPGNDVFDDALTYLPPLGEVAFVPNTGVISSKAAPVFEQYFADVVLSHGFVLTSLFVFSGSFALYFSLRRYLGHSYARRVAGSAKTIAHTKSLAKVNRASQGAAKANRPTAVNATRATTSSRAASKRGVAKSARHTATKTANKTAAKKTATRSAKRK